jgi:hypothetical protein
MVIRLYFLRYLIEIVAEVPPVMVDVFTVFLISFRLNPKYDNEIGHNRFLSASASKIFFASLIEFGKFCR